MPSRHVINALKKYDNFLITAHINPELDALGSELAMYEFLKKIGKKATIINSDEVPGIYRFLDGVGHIKKIPKIKGRFDAAVVVDCPNTDRTGKVKGLLENIDYIINIDHHISNEVFGNANLVDEDASSTAEIIYQLYKKTRVKISKKVAHYIYIAILTDTGSFNYSNTSGKTHQIVSELLSYGIDPHSVSGLVYESKKYEDVRLMGEVISTLRLAYDGRIAYIVCTDKMLTKTGSSIPATENFVDLPRSIKGVLLALFIRDVENKGRGFKISIRSKGDISANRVAATFGGGGHKHAAGCTIIGNLRYTKKKILAAAENEIKQKLRKK